MNFEAKQFTVMQKISERHKTRDVYRLFEDFHITGARPPDEVVMDESRCLLNAAAMYYSKCNNIEEYADLMRNEDKPKTRIRIDTAHFLNTYRGLLKGIKSRHVRTLYMAAIGRLLITDSIEQAENIIHAIFVISNCETCGSLVVSDENEIPELTECGKNIQFLKSLVTEEVRNNEEKALEHDDTDKDFNIFSTSIENVDEDEEEVVVTNYWSTWAKKLLHKAEYFFDEKGTDANGYFLENIDIKKNY
uniref:Uncharacterized protein LOC114343278 n=1 Tax=Diabrotica virgifera virgifera TaxID=50390 RepID=A0A6P7GIZ1_DIAVI